MAKQSGLHQIRGKVGEHSYYRQTGVSGGLIRSINQGLSARVKTDAAYANTRLNNLEFGAACNVASLLGQMVTPKFRPMILPFSQSKMSKEILKLARQNVSPWGQRTVSSSQTAQLAAILSAQSKRNYSEFVSLGVSHDTGNDFQFAINATSEQATLMAGLGIDKLNIAYAAYDLATGNFNVIAGEMATGYLDRVTGDSYYSTVTAGTDISTEETLTVPAFVPASNHSGHQILVAVVMPSRTIDDIDHILQEYCSFVALELPARA